MKTHQPSEISHRPYAMEWHILSPCTGNYVDFCLTMEQDRQFNKYLLEHADEFSLVNYSTDTGMSDRIVDLYFDASLTLDEMEAHVRTIRAYLVRLFGGTV